MRIGIQAWGSEGDIRPFVALGHSLSRAGHDVTLVVTDFEDRDWTRVEEPLGIRIRTVATPVIADPEELGEIGRRLVEAGHPAKQSRIIVRHMFDPVVEPMYEAAQALASESDLMVGHFFLYPTRTAAELAGIPEVSVTLAHNLIPSGDLPPEGIPDVGALWNRFFWRVAAFVVDRSFLSAANRFREAAGAPTYDHMFDAWHSELLDLVAVSPTLCPTPEDWPERHRVSGFLRLPETGDPDPVPPALEAFLSAGDPPVYVTFGSLTPTDPAGRAELREIVERALERTGVRAVVQGLSDGPAVSNRCVHVGRTSHARVFPRCAAVVHHGGAGTTQSALLAGVPSVVIPHVADQFFWSSELRRHGVAARPLPRDELTASSLAGRLDAVVGNLPMQSAARALAEAISLEDGGATAVTLIEDAATRFRGTGD